MGGRHCTEVTFAPRTQPSRGRFQAFPIFSNVSMSPRLINGAASSSGQQRLEISHWSNTSSSLASDKLVSTKKKLKKQLWPPKPNHQPCNSLFSFFLPFQRQYFFAETNTGEFFFFIEGLICCCRSHLLVIVMYGSMKVETCVDLTYTLMKNSNEETQLRAKRKEKKESASHLEGWLFCLFVWLGSGQRAHQGYLVLQKPIVILVNTERVFCVTFLRPFI